MRHKNKSCNKKKVLFINDVCYGGGVQTLLQILAKELSKKYDITIQTWWKFENFYEYYPKNVKHKYRYKKGFNYDCSDNKFLKLFYKLKDKLFKKFLCGYDAIVCMKDREAIPFGSNINMSNKIAWIHNNLHDNIWAKRNFDRLAISNNMLKKFKKVICVSQNVKKSIIDILGDTNNLVTINNPINKEQILQKSKEKCTLPQKKYIRFVTVSRLSEEKGIDLLVDAAILLANKNYKFELYIIGEGMPIDRFTEKIYKNKIDGIKFLGYKQNPFPYVKTADWFISPSKTEAFPYAIREAAVLGIPIIATKNEGNIEFIGENEEYGLLAERTPESIYEKMEQVIIDNSLKEKYINQINIRKKTIHYYSQIKKIEDIIFDM